MQPICAQCCLLRQWNSKWNNGLIQSNLWHLKKKKVKKKNGCCSFRVMTAGLRIIPLLLCISFALIKQQVLCVLKEGNSSSDVATREGAMYLHVLKYRKNTFLTVGVTEDGGEAPALKKDWIYVHRHLSMLTTINGNFLVYHVHTSRAQNTKLYANTAVHCRTFLVIK